MTILTAPADSGHIFEVGHASSGGATKALFNAFARGRVRLTPGNRHGLRGRPGEIPTGPSFVIRVAHELAVALGSQTAQEVAKMFLVQLTV